MFDLYFSNITDRGLVGSFATLEAARTAGRRYGFEFHIICAGQVVGSWEVFRGWRAA